MAKARAQVGPTGITTQQPTALDPAFVGLLLKAGVDAVNIAKGGKDLAGSLKSTDLFVVAVVSAVYNQTGVYVLTLRFTNASGHGAYVESIKVEAAQKREGRPLPDPTVQAGHAISNPGLDDNQEFRGLPLYIGPETQGVELVVRIGPTPGSWAERDAFGKLIAKVRLLNAEAEVDKATTFAIRPRSR